ncbi:hypothetical protein Krac_9924 [Ktedonobacter racemifer DSM 44963]|uniref:Uncharacterized protein n=1 Tax=Ktedonobacter racemifer DSM 44963 TaxID=485913 RepID=D6TE82_KTERA|nr:hypothetical protein Krac_9924 [Ktedonobacter racemifer DSM 44963]
MRLSLFLHIDKRLLTHPSPVPYHLSSGVAFDRGFIVSLLCAVQCVVRFKRTFDDEGNT